MAEFVLIAEQFSQIVSDPGAPLEYKRRRKGEVIELDDAEAERLLRAGAVQPVEQVDADHGADEPDNSADQGAAGDGERLHVATPSAGDVETGGKAPERPKQTAPVADWVDYAVAVHAATNGKHGATRSAAEKLTKRELIESLP